jgi:16S rRNA (cytosine967-C5)-methyltransferase
MLGSAARSVQAGGVLVYATCSSEPEENESVVDAFLAEQPAFTLEDPRTHVPDLPASLVACMDERGCLRTEPHRHGLEAFFAARLRRRS